MQHRTLITATLVALAAPAWAQMSPEGLWRSIDDKTGEAKAEIRIRDTGSAGLVGVLEKRLSKDAKPTDLCVECSDDRKDKPLLGMEIIRGARKGDGTVWEGGKILDPENGRNYTLRMTPIEGGKKLEVRGSFGPFGRTQTWTRVQ